MIQFTKITACVDMAGCPNRCRHCWLGTAPNGSLTPDDLRSVASELRPYTANLEISDWYREPDYRENYREMWALCGELSDSQTPHYELASVWRLVRDETYASWLRERGLAACQLTLFGGEATTDYMVRRRGAYREILRSIDILLSAGIAPRIQVFVSKRNIGELPHIADLIATLELEEWCAAMGREFRCFVHQGSCDGENERFYEEWVTPDDLEMIPDILTRYTLRHFQRRDLREVFGQTEAELCAQLGTDSSVRVLAEPSPVLLIDGNFGVYPNFETPSSHTYLGNLRTDGAGKVLERYRENRSTAQHTAATVPVGEMVRKCGDPDSLRLFTKGDYLWYILNRYCKAL